MTPPLPPAQADTERDHEARESRRRRVARWLPLYPLTGLLVAGVTALAMWPRLPETMVTHWGAGGADASMPRAWAVGSFLAFCVGATCWALLQVFLRRPARTVGDVALFAGLFSWVGAMGLVSSIWLAPYAGLAAAVTLVVPLLLTAAVTWAGNRRLGDALAADPGRSRGEGEGRPRA
ncbi:DUF1648 domain-containing protein [Mobilicoccus massiliensis]|uniref:DUF1648 domain-containing protein n=1 Tax=Mobilicoccus massiliensis TaxID=1522310 RepID=UPI0015971393|nr:DUF1648 domain-containing protein [Mobilicoccus massiliensis]